MPEKAHPLEAIRLDHYWSYHDLSNAIRKVTGIRRTIDCWRRICRGETTNPQGATAHALAKFLQSPIANGKKPRQVA